MSRGTNTKASASSPFDDDEDIEQIKAKSNAIVDESLASTRRMRQMAEETRNTGADTLNMLNEQGG